MSELLATISVETRGNAFYKGDDRFLIKGISYIPHEGGERDSPPIDPLGNDYVDQLKTDIPLLVELGINTISISTLDIAQEHDHALNLLRDSGIYVLINLSSHAAAPKNERNIPDYSNLDPSTVYRSSVVRRMLHTIELTASHTNVLGYVFTANAISTKQSTKLAACIRAGIRDAKHYLQLRHTRSVPVGVRVNDVLTIRKPQQEYYTAGSPDERCDFFAMNCFSWAGDNSSFRISGYSTMVERLSDVPVPMYLSEYGTKMHGLRGFTETACLLSPDMTGVFSGGCIYTYVSSSNDYGIVEIGEDGERTKTQDFCALQERLRIIAHRPSEEVFSGDAVKDYESWRGTFPPQTVFWEGGTQIPPFPLDWKTVVPDSMTETVDRGMANLELQEP